MNELFQEMVNGDQQEGDDVFLDSLKEQMKKLGLGSEMKAVLDPNKHRTVIAKKKPEEQ